MDLEGCSEGLEAVVGAVVVVAWEWGRLLLDNRACAGGKAWVAV